MVRMGEDRTWAADDHLRDAAPERVVLYRLVEAVILACGDVRTSVSKTTITFKGPRRGFAGARPTPKGVVGYLDLTRSLVGDPRIRHAAPYQRNLFVNHYLVTSADDIDDIFRSWVAEAYRVGSGEHLRA